LRAAELIRKFAGARAASLAVDVEPRPAMPREIALDLAAVTSILGVAVPAAEIRRRLKAFGASVAPAGRNRFKVTPPSFRPDINETADLAEEVARLAGLAEIPADLPLRPSVVKPPNPERGFAAKLRDLMMGCGLAEMKTIAFVAPADNQRFPGFAGTHPVRVENPLSAELSEMRLSLLPGLVAALRFNLNREAPAFHGFELGKVFGARDGVPAEFERVAAISYGDYALGAIGHPAVKAGFFSMKGIVETTLTGLGLPHGCEFEPITGSAAPYLHPARSATIRLDGNTLGVIGELHPTESLRLDLNDPCVLVELDMRHLLAYGSQSRQGVEAPPRFPVVRRDLALVLDLDFPADKVLRTVAELGSPLMESVELFDVYEGSSVPAGKKSVALACRYRRKDRTLTDEEVNRAHALLVERATARLGAELRQ